MAVQTQFFLFSLHWKRTELQNQALGWPEMVGLRLLLCTRYTTVWTNTWTRNLLGVIKHAEMMCSWGSPLNWKQLGGTVLWGTAGNVLCVLVLFLAFPRDPLGTQNTGPGELLLWPSMAAVIISLSVICLFSRHTVCSMTISITCFKNSKLPMWFFSRCEDIFLL